MTYSFVLQTRLSQGDFTMMMKLLNENLTEGQTPAPKVPAVEAPGITAAIEGPIQSETSPRTSGKFSTHDGLLIFDSLQLL